MSPLLRSVAYFHHFVGKQSQGNPSQMASRQSGDKSLQAGALTLYGLFQNTVLWNGAQWFQLAFSAAWRAYVQPFPPRPQPFTALRCPRRDLKRRRDAGPVKPVLRSGSPPSADSGLPLHAALSSFGVSCSCKLGLAGGAQPRPKLHGQRFQSPSFEDEHKAPVGQVSLPHVMNFHGAAEKGKRMGASSSTAWRQRGDGKSPGNRK